MAAPPLIVLAQRLAVAGSVLLWLTGSPTDLILQAPQPSQTTTGEITGTVTDNSGAIMPGVTVTARGTKGTKVLPAVTDQSGQFRIGNLPDDSYVLTAMLAGFQSVTTTTAIRQGEHVDLGKIKMDLGRIEEPNLPGLSPGDLLVSVTTSAGNFTLVVATKAAPEAAREFLKRVDGHSYDGGTIVPLLAIQGQQAQGAEGLELVMNPGRHPEPFRVVIAGYDLEVEPGRQVFGRVWRWQEREDVVSKIRFQPLSGRSFAVPVTIAQVSRMIRVQPMPRAQRHRDVESRLPRGREQVATRHACSGRPKRLGSSRVA